MNFTHVKEGDKITRMLAGTIPMPLTVSQVDEDLIHCGSWTFDRQTGAEVDHDLKWGPTYGRTGSYLVGDDDAPLAVAIIDPLGVANEKVDHLVGDMLERLAAEGRKKESDPE